MSFWRNFSFCACQLLMLRLLPSRSTLFNNFKLPQLAVRWTAVIDIMSIFAGAPTDQNFPRFDFWTLWQLLFTFVAIFQSTTPYITRTVLQCLYLDRSTLLPILCHLDSDRIDWIGEHVGYSFYLRLAWICFNQLTESVFILINFNHFFNYNINISVKNM